VTPAQRGKRHFIIFTSFRSFMTGFVYCAVGLRALGAESASEKKFVVPTRYFWTRAIPMLIHNLYRVISGTIGLLR